MVSDTKEDTPLEEEQEEEEEDQQQLKVNVE